MSDFKTLVVDKINQHEIEEKKFDAKIAEINKNIILAKAEIDPSTIDDIMIRNFLLDYSTYPKEFYFKKVYSSNAGMNRQVRYEYSNLWQKYESLIRLNIRDRIMKFKMPASIEHFVALDEIWEKNFLEYSGQYPLISKVEDTKIWEEINIIPSKSPLTGFGSDDNPWTAGEGITRGPIDITTMADDHKVFAK